VSKSGLIRCENAGTLSEEDRPNPEKIPACSPLLQKCPDFFDFPI
jgi:hypothetical protein